MARPLRVEQPGGRYHVIARGNERKDVFRNAVDRFRFLALLLGELGQRFGGRVRDAALGLGRRVGRLSLAQLGRLAGGLDYAAVGQAVSRLGKRLENNPKLQRQISSIECELSNVEM